MKLNAKLIKGVICGYRVEDIANPKTEQVRYLDRVVDELAKGRTMEKILRLKWDTDIFNNFLFKKLEFAATFIIKNGSTLKEILYL